MPYLNKAINFTLHYLSQKANPTLKIYQLNS